MAAGASEERINRALADHVMHPDIKLVDIDELRPHEHVDPKRVDEIAGSIRAIGLQYPIVADRKTKIILDGHHRYNAFRKMNINKIPVYYMDYEDRRIIVDSWTGKKITKQDVIDKVRSGGLFPEKTTKHMLLTEKGPVHISSALPRVNLDL